MISFIKICFFTFTIWVTASLINGVLFACMFSLGELIQGGFSESFGLAALFSMVFSLPAIFILWLIFLCNSSEPDLSVRLLKFTFLLSLFSYLLIAILPQSEYGGHWLLLSFNIILSSVLSVLLHHPVFLSFKKEKHV